MFSRRRAASATPGDFGDEPPGCQGGKAAETVLQAWFDCQMEGYTLDVRRVPELLPVIALRVSESCGSSVRSAAGAASAHELFAWRGEGERPVFLRLLKRHGSKVHFVYFWKAFSDTANLAGPFSSPERATYELETLRDSLLRRVEEEQECASAVASSSFLPGIPAWALVEEVHRAAAMSAHPQFWQRISGSLDAQRHTVALTLQELSAILVGWLYEATMWEAQHAVANFSRCRVESGPGHQVLIHIYDVSQEESIQRLNWILAHKRSPIKFGGVFHAGVEVNGLEWSYGYQDDEDATGVSCAVPRTHEQHRYRQTIALKRTQLSADAIANVITLLVEEYPAEDYDILHNNCCHFADDLCKRLGVGGIPGWIQRLARVGARVDAVLHTIEAVRHRVSSRSLPDRQIATDEQE